MMMWYDSAFMVSLICKFTLLTKDVEVIMGRISLCRGLFGDDNMAISQKYW